MKKLFNLVLGTVIFNSLAISAQAQSSSACFMLDANGKAIDLGYLCQNSNSTNSRPARVFGSKPDLLPNLEFKSFQLKADVREFL